MSISYERTGRTLQKGRTRDALIEGARSLLAQGVVPTVEQAAATASVSRPTAYRYFPNQRALLVAARPELGMSSLLGDDPPADAAARLERLTDVLTRMVLDDEPTLRAMLSLALEERSDPGTIPLRSGRRIVWVEDALAPLAATMDAAKFHALVRSVAAVLGIEMLVWLTGVAGLSREEAREEMRSMAHRLAGL